MQASAARGQQNSDGDDAMMCVDDGINVNGAGRNNGNFAPPSFGHQFHSTPGSNGGAPPLHPSAAFGGVQQQQPASSPAMGAGGAGRQQQRPTPSRPVDMGSLTEEPPVASDARQSPNRRSVFGGAAAAGGAGGFASLAERRRQLGSGSGASGNLFAAYAGDEKSTAGAKNSAPNEPRGGSATGNGDGTGGGSAADDDNDFAVGLDITGSADDDAAEFGGPRRYSGGPLVPAEARMALTAAGAVPVDAILRSPPPPAAAAPVSDDGAAAAAHADEEDVAPMTAQHLTLVVAKLSAQEERRQRQQSHQPETVPEPMEREEEETQPTESGVTADSEAPQDAGAGDDDAKLRRTTEMDDEDVKPRRRQVTREEATRLRRRMQGIIEDSDDENDIDEDELLRRRPKCLSVPLHLHGRDVVLSALAEGMARGALVKIDLSQRGLRPVDARPLAEALFRNPGLEVLRLAFNDLGDEGSAMLAAAIKRAAEAPSAFTSAASMNGTRAAAAVGMIAAPATHHRSLSILDLGFNGVGDGGCRALAEWAVAGNATLRTLHLSGNVVREGGALTLAAALVQGGYSGLTSVRLAANPIGAYGTKAVTRAVAEVEARRVSRLAAAAGGAGALGGAAAGMIPGMMGDPNAAAALAAMPDGASIEELHLAGTDMGPDGCLSVSNMLLTNFALRVLSLSDVGMDDADLSLFSQAASRNKNVPLEVLDLSRNNLTCAGVESLMNAVWGSPTLKTLKLDGNRIRDRGAQLCAVVLTSVKLSCLDLSFNDGVTGGGVKALMKSLAENDGLRELNLSGIELDTNSAKAISYALAYNGSLVSFGADQCSVGYAAQRHIAAGIVSNPNLKLRRLTGFRIGPIAVTLGLPSALEEWSNGRSLAFIRHMWERRKQDEERELQEQALMGFAAGQNGNAEKKKKAGPADPGTVVKASKAAYADFEEVENAARAKAQLEDSGVDGIRSDGCPVSEDGSVLLERTSAGGLRALTIVSPHTVDDDDEEEARASPPTKRGVNSARGGINGVKDFTVDDERGSLPNISFASTEALELATVVADPVRRARITEWLRQHAPSLSEMARQPFDSNDLRSLQEHYYSPLGDVSAMPAAGDSFASTSFTHLASGGGVASRAQPPSREGTPSPSYLNYASSGAYLSDAASSSSFAIGRGADDSASNLSEAQTPRRRRNRRRSVDMMGDSDTESAPQARPPACKRARSNKLRIAYYPRLREKLEEVRNEADPQQTLILMRQLKFVESTLLQGRNVYSDAGVEDDPNQPSPSDVDLILVDVLQIILKYQS